jgi:hypothetical protein
LSREGLKERSSFTSCDIADHQVRAAAGVRV